MKRIAIFLILLAFSLVSFGQMPTIQTDPNRQANLKDFIKNAKFNRVVTVDPIYGQFKTIGAAITYVTAQSPTPLSPWIITVYPAPVFVGSQNSYCGYTESSIVVPPSTLIQGYGVMHPTPVGYTSLPVLCLTGTAGTLIKFQSESQMSDFSIFYRTAMTAAVNIMEIDWSGQATNQAPIIKDVSINTLSSNGNTFALNALTVTHGSAYTYGLSVFITGNTLGNAVLNNETGSNGITLYNGRFACATSCGSCFTNASTGLLKLYNVRIDPKCTNDLVNASSGTFETHETDYVTSSGTISDGASHHANGTTNPATCAVGQMFINTTSASEKICYCTATNVWKCSAGT